MDGLLDWYLLGVVIGLGVAAGAAFLLARRSALVGALAIAGALGGAVAIALAALPVWTPAVGAAAAILGAVALRRLSSAALPFAFLVLTALAAFPLAGYLEALAAPVLGERISRRAGTRYAGLRVLAKD
ncbi:MAG: hypothetical protein KY396_07785 [Actinobacteria bacterium]|nr:hypothetical protein [Actinomycetota bacterium]